MAGVPKFTMSERDGNLAQGERRFYTVISTIARCSSFARLSAMDVEPEENVHFLIALPPAGPRVRRTASSLSLITASRMNISAAVSVSTLLSQIKNIGS